MTKGLKQSVCDQSFYIGPVSKFWAYAFVLSKAPELGEYPLSIFSRYAYWEQKCLCRKHKKGLSAVEIRFSLRKTE